MWYCAFSLLSEFSQNSVLISPEAICVIIIVPSNSAGDLLKCFRAQVIPFIGRIVVIAEETVIVILWIVVCHCASPFDRLSEVYIIYDFMRFVETSSPAGLTQGTFAKVTSHFWGPQVLGLPGEDIEASLVFLWYNNRQRQ